MKYDNEFIINAIEKNVYSLSLLPRCKEGSMYSDRQDISWIYTGNTQLNRVFDIHLENDIDSKIDEVMNVYKKAGVPVTWILTKSTSPVDMGDRLNKHGVNFAHNWTGMALDIDMMKHKDTVCSDYEIVEVLDEKALRAWNHVVCAGFSIPENAREDFFSIFNSLGVGPNLPYSHYLLIKKGIPSAACTLYRKDGIAGLYWVAAIPEARRQGLASGVVCHALECAASEGFRISVLQASDAGKGVYEKIGFSTYCTFDIYKWNSVQ